MVVSVSLFLLLSKLVSLAYNVGESHKNSPSLCLYDVVDCLIESSGYFGQCCPSCQSCHFNSPAVQQIQFYQFIVYSDGTVYIHGRVHNTENSKRSGVGLLLNPLRSPQ